MLIIHEDDLDEDDLEALAILRLQLGLSGKEAVKFALNMTARNLPVMNVPYRPPSRWRRKKPAAGPVTAEMAL